MHRHGCEKVSDLEKRAYLRIFAGSEYERDYHRTGNGNGAPVHQIRHWGRCVRMQGFT